MNSTKDFRALALANKERSAYGLRYNDFARYRKHCANKVHRLRSALKLTHGKGKTFKKLPELTPVSVQGTTLQLLLFEAERLYAYAQELYHAEQHHKAIAKHRRSLAWANRLLSLCLQLAPEQFSASRLCEVLAYAHILTAKLSFKRDQFDLAVKHHSVAYHLLTLLQSVQRSSRDHALANVFMDEISPEIRFSAHELGISRSHDVPKLVESNGKKHSASSISNYQELAHNLQFERDQGISGDPSEELRPRVWEREVVPVRNPELVDVLFRVQQAEDKMEPLDQEKPYRRARVKAYEPVLQAWTDAEDVARKLTESDQLMGQSSSGLGRDAGFVHSYIMYNLLLRRSERDTLLARALFNNSTKNQQPQETKIRNDTAIIKLLSTTLQSLSQIRSLSIVEESPDVASRIDASISFGKARRCLFLARSYGSPSRKSYGEALALTQRALLDLREAHNASYTLENSPELASIAVPSPADLVTLEQQLLEEERKYKAEWFNMNGGKVSLGLIKEQHQKPLFFDIALNYIEPNTDAIHARTEDTNSLVAETTPAQGSVDPESVAADSSQSESVATSRLGGILGGWWGRK